jgi:hypothetical protein
LLSGGSFPEELDQPPRFLRRLRQELFAARRLPFKADADATVRLDRLYIGEIPRVQSVNPSGEYVPDVTVPDSDLARESLRQESSRFTAHETERAGDTGRRYRLEPAASNDLSSDGLFDRTREVRIPGLIIEVREQDRNRR